MSVPIALIDAGAVVSRLCDERCILRALVMAIRVAVVKRRSNWSVRKHEQEVRAFSKGISECNQRNSQRLLASSVSALANNNTSGNLL